MKNGLGMKKHRKYKHKIHYNPNVMYLISARYNVKDSEMDLKKKLKTYSEFVRFKSLLPDSP